MRGQTKVDDIVLTPKTLNRKDGGGMTGEGKSDKVGVNRSNIS